MAPIRTLILSGGGGRGAFHAGVYKYLQKTTKPGVKAEYQGVWTPDIIVGTSIGAVNGAAIAQDISADELERIWLSLRERDIQGLPPGMRGMTRFLMNRFLKKSIGVTLPHVSPAFATSPPTEQSWPPIPMLPNFLSERLVGRWNNLIDTGPLMQTMRNRFNLDEERINASEKLLLIEATNIRTGEQVAFCNRPAGLEHQPTIKKGITLNRILASCSIPLVYPWTPDTDDNEAEELQYYWDGAVVANTPLGDALDAVSDRPITEKMEAVVVLMTPWNSPELRRELPKNFGEAITWTLDWALLASFRVSLELIQLQNTHIQQALTNGEEPPYRAVDVVIVAPDNFLPVTRIIDYDEEASRDLIAAGERAAEIAFTRYFKASPS